MTNYKQVFFKAIVLFLMFFLTAIFASAQENEQLITRARIYFEDGLYKKSLEYIDKFLKENAGREQELKKDICNLFLLQALNHHRLKDEVSRDESLVKLINLSPEYDLKKSSFFSSLDPEIEKAYGRLTNVLLPRGEEPKPAKEKYFKVNFVFTGVPGDLTVKALVDGSRQIQTTVRKFSLPLTSGIHKIIFKIPGYEPHSEYVEVNGDMICSLKNLVKKEIKEQMPKKPEAKSEKFTVVYRIINIPDPKTIRVIVDERKSQTFNSDRIILSLTKGVHKLDFFLEGYDHMVKYLEVAGDMSLGIQYPLTKKETRTQQTEIQGKIQPSSSAYTKTNRLNLTLLGNYLMGSDKYYKKTYGNGQVMPEIIIEVKLFSGLFVWTSGGFVYAKGEAPLSLKPAESTQILVSGGVGYVIGKTVQFRVRAGALFAMYKEESLGDSVSDNAFGFNVGGGVIWQFVKFMGISVDAAYTSASDTVKELDVNIGGIKVGAGICFLF